MRTVRASGMGLLIVAAGLTGCQSVAVSAETDPADAPASVETDPDGGPSRLTLVDEAIKRLGIETVPVQGEGGSRSIPYSAVVYDGDGATWTFVEQEAGVYQREAITVSAVDGDTARLSDGPDTGSDVVTVGAAELVGVEAGISGGE